MQSAYEKLIADKEFSSGLGQAVLAAGRFEFLVKKYIIDKRYLDDPSKKMMLGPLIMKLAENKILGCTLEYHLHFLREQRNYFVHQIYELLNEIDIDDFEIQRFRNRVLGVRDEFEQFSRMITNESELDIG